MGITRCALIDMVQIAIVLSLLFGMLGTLSIALLSANFTKSHRKRYRLLRYVSQKRVLFLILSLIFVLAGFGATLCKDLLITTQSHEFEQGPLGGIFKKASVSEFQKEIREAAGDRVGEATAYFIAGKQDLDREKFWDAIANFEKSTQAMTTMSTMINLGFAHVITGNLERAAAAFEMGLEIARRKNNEFATELFLAEMATATALQGKFLDAEGFAREGLDIAIKRGKRFEIALTSGMLGSVYASKKDAENASRFLNYSLQLQRNDETGLRAATLTVLAGVYIQQNRIDEGIKLLNASLRIAQHEGQTVGQVAAMLWLAEAAALQNALDAEFQYADTALRLAKKIQSALGESSASYLIGHFYMQRKKYDDSLKALLYSLKIQQSTFQPLTTQAETLKMVIHVYEEQGNFHEMLGHMKILRAVYVKMGDAGTSLRQDLDKDLFWAYFTEAQTKAKLPEVSP